MTSQSSVPNAIFATFANDISAEHARCRVHAEDNDGDIPSVGNALIDVKHDGMISFLFIGAYIEFLIPRILS